MAIATGTQLGPYEVLSALGAGGMGEVYRAKDARLGRDVALKVLPESLLESEEKRVRFEREAKMLAALNHPNIAAIYSFEEDGGRHILVMELIEGETLRKAFPQEPLAAKKILDIAVQIADGLAKAHAAGIVHRDLKPENAMVPREGWVKILDFGPVDGDVASLPPERRARIRALPTALDVSLDALENDHDFLTKDGVFPADLIPRWIQKKREEDREVRNRPHPYEIELYYDL